MKTFEENETARHSESSTGTVLFSGLSFSESPLGELAESKAATQTVASFCCRLCGTKRTSTAFTV